ncbi:hypothetical protein HW132_10635 [Brasilonema sp. CT11]|nr:hypothetical protein [Brasilonema sp. CT11]
MSREVTIKSTCTDAKLEFLNFGNDCFRVLFESRTLSASKDVWLYADGDYSDCQFLVNLFREMARAWKGWEGEKTWRSTEADFVLCCTSDKLGHINLEVHLLEFDGSPWSANFNLDTEAGELEKISNEVAMFFGFPGGVPGKTATDIFLNGISSD